MNRNYISNNIESSSNVSYSNFKNSDFIPDIIISIAR